MPRCLSFRLPIQFARLAGHPMYHWVVTTDDQAQRASSVTEVKALLITAGNMY
jgi:hypothetical protein